jgi:transcriptional regulator with XRE-family HTH domain
MGVLAAAVSDILRGIAAKQRITPGELARRTGFHKSKASRLLSGATTIGIDEADMICRVLGVDLDKIIRDAIAETPDRPPKSTADERLMRSI